VDAIRAVVLAGKFCVLNLHPQSLKILKESDLMPFVVFVAPPSLEKLRAKKRDRGETVKVRTKYSLSLIFFLYLNVYFLIFLKIRMMNSKRLSKRPEKWKRFTGTILIWLSSTATRNVPMANFSPKSIDSNANRSGCQPLGSIDLPIINNNINSYTTNR